MTNYIRFKQLQRYVPVTRPTIWQWVKDGIFPPPIQLRPGQPGSPVMWPEDEIIEWVTTKPRGWGIGTPEAHEVRRRQGRNWRGPTTVYRLVRHSPFPWERNGHDKT
jgi:predicted DNA-binding transcriptional regulator AlpA